MRKGALLTARSGSSHPSKKRLLSGLMAVGGGLLLLLVLAMGLANRAAAPGSVTTAVTLPSNPYGPEDFGYENGYLTCLAGESRLGIDVSTHQGIIDWQQVADAGIQFAMIRVGYRGYGTGLIDIDEDALQNLKGASDAGLEIGAYFFSQATTAAEARAEAEFTLDILKDYPVTMPVVFDWERVSEDTAAAAVDGDTMTDCAEAFCRTVADAGYTPMVYFNQSQAEWEYELERLSDYPFWLAMYDDQMTFPTRLTMWQYTETGTVPGINGYVDIDLYFPS